MKDNWSTHTHSLNDEKGNTFYLQKYTLFRKQADDYVAELSISVKASNANSSITIRYLFI